MMRVIENRAMVDGGFCAEVEAKREGMRLSLASHGLATKKDSMLDIAENLLVAAQLVGDGCSEIERMAVSHYLSRMSAWLREAAD